MSGEVIIRKQKIRITTPSEKLAFECRQFADESLVTDLTKMYEHLFFQGTQSDQYVIINSLKVDLGTLCAHDFKHHFLGLLEEKLINELRNQFETVAESNTSEKEISTEPDAAKKPDPIIYSTESEQYREALLVFLQSGNFPWWYQKQIGKTPAEILKDFGGNDQISFLLALITKAGSLRAQKVKQIIKRLFQQLNESAFETYLTELTKLFSDPSLVANVETIISQGAYITALFHVSLRDFYEQAVVCVLLKKDEPDFLRQFFIDLQQNFPVTTGEVHERKVQNKLENFGVKSEPKLADKQPEEKTISISETADEGFYVSNAGLVILHPFLVGFFKGLGFLSDENQFTSVETQNKAAVLLYYLQCGLVEYKEWEMPLNKILCGMATDEVITHNVMVSEHEKDECDLLLKSVVEYWTALKGASIEALQTTFIVREGKITFKENHWLIQVERTGVDILLDRLPWGIGTIKLPWLKEIIYIEW